MKVPATTPLVHAADVTPLLVDIFKNFEQSILAF